MGIYKLTLEEIYDLQTETERIGEVIKLKTFSNANELHDLFNQLNNQGNKVALLLNHNDLTSINDKTVNQMKYALIKIAAVSTLLWRKLESIRIENQIKLEINIPAEILGNAIEQISTDTDYNKIMQENLAEAKSKGEFLRPQDLLKRDGFPSPGFIVPQRLIIGERRLSEEEKNRQRAKAFFSSVKL